MRHPRFRLRTLMVAVALVALLARPAIMLLKACENFGAYLSWASNKNPNRPLNPSIPYPEASDWPFSPPSDESDGR
jgi:hypothetical protein